MLPYTLIIREVNPLPAAVNFDPLVPAPKISSLAAVVLTLPLFAAVPVPAAPTALSSGALGSSPLYSRIRTSGYAAALLNVTVTVVLPPAMFGAK